MRMQSLAWISASCIFVVVITMSQWPVAVKPQASSLLGPDQTENRISRIEFGLLPAAVIQGQSLPRMLLTDRIKHFDVPGDTLASSANGQRLPPPRLPPPDI